ncbi:MAG: M13 family metallopeptidase [Polyangiales bacterium]
MRARLFIAAVLASPFVVGLACRTTPQPNPPSPPTTTSTLGAGSATPAPALSASTSTSSAATTVKAPTLGVDPAAMNASLDPCDDFFAYACGGWQKATPIPEDEAVWARGFSEVDERNLVELRAILEKNAASKTTDAYGQKLGDFWAACMDEDGIEKAGIQPLEEPFAVIERMGKSISLAKGSNGPLVERTIADLHKLGFSPLFSLSSGQDFGDATQVIGQLEQAGLGMPDRDYYLSNKPKMVEARAAYEDHVGKMLALAGLPAAGAKSVMALETELAKASMTRVDRRDPKKVYHKMKRVQVAALSPGFAWNDFFDALSVPADAPINVAQPEFFRSIEARVTKASLEDWQTYLRWTVIRELSAQLPARFVDEDFHYRSKVLTGAGKLLPRWKRCVHAAKNALGEALGQPFVRDHFGADGKARTQGMVGEIEEAMRRDLESLPWMDQKTKQRAMEKLGKIHNKIGYPDAWRNYDALEVGRRAYATNVLHASAFELRRVLAKIGKPVDRNEWYMSPPEVNAYYDANLNEMVFPAGILQTPFFDKAAPMPANYGAIGMVMGHELTHGFDDEGRQFDGDGNLKEWWTPKVSKDFDKRAKCIVDQYDGFVAIDDLHVDGKLTLGENIADNGGIKLAFASFVEARKKGEAAEKGAARTPEQEFFLAYAQSWCQNERPEFRRTRTATDPHSPAHWRVNGPLSNFSSFATAFQCAEGKKMAPKNRCEVW